MIAPAETSTFATTLRRRYRDAADRARRLSQPIVVSLTERVPAPSDPVALFTHAAAAHDYRAYWEQPADGFVLAGIGAARVIRCDGETRFRDAATAVRDDMASALCDSPLDVYGGPIYLGGFAFSPDHADSIDWDGFPAGLLVLPRFMLAVRDGIATHTLNAVIEPDTDPIAAAGLALRDLTAFRTMVTGKNGVDHDTAHVLTSREVPGPDAFKEIVATSAADVRGGRIEKVVLARTLRLRAAGAFDPGVALRRLRGAGPAATVFAVSTGGRCFLGATPERLVRLDGREVAVTCLAGSIARGATIEEDDRLAGALLASAKDRTEHEVVVRAVRDALSAVCDEVIRPEDTPRVVRSRNVQHLSTPLQGRLVEGRGVLDLVERLHPTPAVGGFPRDLALETIHAREGFDRGWYAGPVGWVNRDGEGEFAVAIRSALLDGHEATLYGGAGIVADSNPESEYAETGLKMKPMLAALGVR